MMTNQNDAKAIEQAYRPFGQIAVTVTADVTEPAENRGWIGERYDAGAGLQYLNARYYDPKLGLFLQPDWFEVTQAGVGTNRYAYAGNDPVNLSDPGGNWFVIDDAFEIIVLGGLGIAAYLGVSGAQNTLDDLEGFFGLGQSDLDFVDKGMSTDTTGSHILADPIQVEDRQTEGFSISRPIPSGSITYAPDTEFADNIVYASRLRGALGLNKNDGLIAHHLIPKQLQDHLAVQAAGRAGFDLDGAANGQIVFGQQGGHPNYNSRILGELNRLADRGGTNDEMRQGVQQIADRERQRIQNDGSFVYYR
jgi:RHS repeat-associated protein